MVVVSGQGVGPGEHGFSPNDLVFGHTVHGSLALLQDNWKEAQPSKNLIEYVNGFRYELHKAQEVARDNLESTQGKMKKSPGMEACFSSM